MTDEEVERVIEGFRLGGEKSYSIYPPGERIRWSFDKSKGCFCERVQSLSDEYTKVYTEAEMRSYLREMDFQYWKDVYEYCFKKGS